MTNRVHPYFSREPRVTARINVLHNSPEPRYYRPSSSTKIINHVQKYVPRSPLSSQSNHSDDSSFSNSFSNSYSFAIQVERSNLKKKDLIIEKLTSDLNQALIKIRELYEREMKIVFIKNQNVNLSTQIRILKDKLKLLEQSKQNQFFDAINGSQIEFSEENKRLKEQINILYNSNKSMNRQLQETNKILQREQLNFFLVSSRCEKLQLVCKQLQLRISEASYGKYISLADRLQEKQNKPIPISREAYTTFYQ